MKHLFSLLFGILILMTLSSCQDFSPRNPQVPSSNPNLESTLPRLESFDFAAEDWQTLEGEGISLSLPETYRGGNPLRDLTNLETALSDLDKSYEKRLQPIKQNLDQIAFIAFDARSLTAEALTNVNVVQQRMNQKISLEDYLATTVKQLQATHQVEEQTLLTQNQSSLGRIVANVTTEEGVTLKQVFYLQPKGATVWITTYTTPTSEFKGRLPNFEQSIASLDIQT